MKDATDPRRPGGDIVGPGGPQDQGAFLVDMQHGVLLDGCTVVLVDPVRNGQRGDRPVLAMTLEGRINKTTERARRGNAGSAVLIEEEEEPRFMARIDELLREGAM